MTQQIKPGHRQDAAVVQAILDVLAIAEATRPGIIQAAQNVTLKAVRHGSMMTFQPQLAGLEWDAWERIKHVILPAADCHKGRNYLLGLVCETLLLTEINHFMVRNSRDIVPERA